MLKTIIRIGLALTALALAAPLHAGEAPATVDAYWHCHNIQSSPTATLYVSKLFDANAGQGEVYAAYKAMLASKYGITSQVSCSAAYKTTLGVHEKLVGDNARWFQQIRAGGGKVVDTGWTYATEAEAAPVPAPVASAAPAVASKTWQCWSSGIGGSYITPGFDSSKDYTTLNAGWRAFITQAHPPTGATQIRCVEIDPRQAANNLRRQGARGSTGRSEGALLPIVNVRSG